MSCESGHKCRHSRSIFLLFCVWISIYIFGTWSEIDIYLIFGESERVLVQSTARIRNKSVIVQNPLLSLSRVSSKKTPDLPVNNRKRSVQLAESVVVCCSTFTRHVRARCVYIAKLSCWFSWLSLISFAATYILRVSVIISAQLMLIL